MDPVDLEEITRLCTAWQSAQKLPDGTIILPDGWHTASLEQFLPARMRTRGRFNTALIEDFANYYARNTKADKLAHAPIFINPKALAAVAVLDWQTLDDLPGHLDHVAVCTPQATPEFERIRAMHNREHTQEEMVDLIDDMSGIVSGFDDAGQGMAASALLKAFRETKITKQSEHAQTLNDQSVSRSALESIDANASKRVPPKLTFHITPYEGFGPRALTGRIIIRAKNNEPVFWLRVADMAGIERDIAREFVNLVQKAIGDFFDSSNTDAPSIYVGSLDTRATL